MLAVRVEIDGTLTSFRYPHFLVGRQPTYPLPPLSTIYGHICSAFGEWVDPAPLQCAYSFSHAGRVDDLEHVHLASVGSGRPYRDWPHPVNVEANVNPILREAMLAPHVTLYVRTDGDLGALAGAFREPRFVVTLGRSQDLASYRSVDVVDLVPSAAGYVSGSLLPAELRGRVGFGVPLLMPRFIDPQDRRRVVWSRFVAVEQRVLIADASTMLATPGDEEGNRPALWVDPGSPEYRGHRRAVFWHRFVGADEEAVHLAPRAG